MAATPLPGDDFEIDVEGRAVRLSTIRRVLWPALGYSKGHLLDYYVRVAPVLLPHLVGRPLTLHRFPGGIDGPHFFQTRCPPHPPWIRVQRMYTFRSGKEVDAPVIDDLAGLVWAVNLATIELHPFLSCAETLERPEMMVFDLDPGPPAGLIDTCRVALELRGMLAGVGLESFPKTSGAKGLHVHVPLAPVHSYDETKAFARQVASVLTRAEPDHVVDRMTRSLRPGKVFVDWSQNDAGKSTVVPYSLRALPVPTVAMPVTWEEVEATVESGSTGALRFGPDDAHARIADRGDLFEPVLTLEQRLPTA